MRLVVLDNVKGQTGYAKSTRELVRAISAYIPVVFPNDCPKPEPTDYILGRTYFQNLRQFYGKKLIGNLVLESTKIPEEIVCDANKHYAKIWCPSNFCKNNYINSGIIPEKIDVIPHGVDTSIYKPLNKPHKDFTFLFVGGYTGKGDRKGADLLCKAFTEEFKSDTNVKLYLKINTVYGNAVHELVELTKDISNRVTFNTLNLTEEEMNEVYNIGDCFVSPSYGEGFNMTVLEAMSVGLTIITTNWGGQMDYIPAGNLFIYGEFTVPRYSPYDIGRWYKPDIDMLKKEMRYVYENKKDFIGVGNLNSKVASEWSWDSASKKAIASLLSI